MIVPTPKAQMYSNLARYVRHATDDGQELINLILKIMRGKLPDHKLATAKDRLRLRFEAAQWLVDRGWGKVPQQIELDVIDATDEILRSFTLDELRAMAVAIPALPESEVSGPGVKSYPVVRGALSPVANHDNDNDN